MICYSHKQRACDGSPIRKQISQDLKIKLMVHPSHTVDPLTGLFPEEDWEGGSRNRSYQNIESFNTVAISLAPTGEEEIRLGDQKILALQNTCILNINS